MMTTVNQTKKPAPYGSKYFKVQVNIIYYFNTFQQR